MAKPPKEKDLALAIKEYNSLRKRAQEFQYIHFHSPDLSAPKTFTNLKLKGVQLSDARFDNCAFLNCTFENVDLTRCSIAESEFIDCSFIDCDLLYINLHDVQFVNTQFEGGQIVEGNLYEVEFNNVIIESSQAINDIRFDRCSFFGLTFAHSRLSYLNFDDRRGRVKHKITFDLCGISHSAFCWFNFGAAVFENNLINYCTFSNCQLFPQTLLPSNKTADASFSSIDFQSILRSEISTESLKKHFGIHNADLKHYVIEMVSPVELHTVFISYSFTDKVIAHRLNEALQRRGAFTFLWEKDSPAGQRLKKIMVNNVHKFDKLLFIASKHSLKSEACHFELTNGRKKQDKNWDIVLFPVHIDSFLFSVDPDDIPRKNRAEFWTNIEELREINSMDLSPFAAETVDQTAFDQQVDKLIRGLKKEKREGK